VGRRSLNGVRPKGSDRIEFEFIFRGKRYRPSLPRIPTEANLRRASVQLREIKQRIKYGTFNFREEFPDYRFTETPSGEMPPDEGQTEPTGKETRPVVKQTLVAQERKKKERTCDQVFQVFLRHCDMRVANGDMAFSTVNGYRKLLERNWRPALGNRPFTEVVYSELVNIAFKQGWTTKTTYNNGISAVRCAFEFGYKDHPKEANPGLGLESFRILKRDRPKVDPFTIQEAEQLITAIHVEWGEPIGNLDEFRFFTGLRQSEEISLRVSDCDLEKGTFHIHQVVCSGGTKTGPRTTRIASSNCAHAHSPCSDNSLRSGTDSFLKKGFCTTSSSSKTMARRFGPCSTPIPGGARRSTDQAFATVSPTTPVTPA
jgi:integrase